MYAICCSSSEDGVECMHGSTWNGDHPNSLQMYVFYNNQVVMCEIICSLERRYALQLQRECYAVGDRVVSQGDAADGVRATESVARREQGNEALQCLAS